MAYHLLSGLGIGCHVEEGYGCLFDRVEGYGYPSRASGS